MSIKVSFLTIFCFGPLRDSRNLPILTPSLLKSFPGGRVGEGGSCFTWHWRTVIGPDGVNLDFGRG